MATRTWIGGGNNKADNPNDWSPTGLPLPREQLFLSSGTIRVEGDQLFAPGGLGQSRLFVDGNSTIEISKHANVMPIIARQGALHINIKDDAAFRLANTGGSTVVDLANNAQWVGGFTGTSSAVVNGDHGAKFITDPFFNSVDGSSVFLNVDVGGGGKIFIERGTLEVGKSVDAGLVFDVNSDLLSIGFFTALKIDHPEQFGGQVNLGVGEIDLVGLTKADSYSYMNDMLSIYSNNVVIDKIAVHQEPSASGETLKPLAVSVTSFGVVAYASQLDHSPGSPLPVHT